MASTAHAIDIKTEAILAKTLGSYTIDSSRNGNRLKLSYLSTDGTHLMAVTIVIIAGLIARSPLKTVANHQPHFHKELQRIIQCGPTDGETQFPVQLLAQLLKREMSYHTIDSIQNSITLRSLAMIVQFQIARQYVSDCRLIAFSHFMWLNWLKTAQNYYFFFRIRQDLFKKNLN
jgi:hypothetical protein